MSTPDTTPDTISDTIPGGGPDETSDTVLFQDCAPGWITYDGFTCVLDDRPATTFAPETTVAISTVPPTTTPATTEAVAVIAPATTEAVAVVGVKPATLPATGAGDAMSIGITATIVLGLGAVALIVRRKVARV
jgi:LPXTG-motif cell wall-anchored protein